MKKLMTLVAVLFIAATTQAASVTWAWAATMQDDGFTGLNGTVAFYFSVAAPLVGATAFDSVTSIADDGLYVGNTYTADHTALNGQTVWMRFTNNGYYIQESFAVSGLVGGGNPADSSAIQGWVDGVLNTMYTPPTGDTSGFVMGNQVANWTAVPEPTSMALLALGVAAVGLRRRFKK